MKVNIIKVISDNNIEFDERISKENIYISSLMLVIIKIAFVIAILFDSFSNKSLSESSPILYYALLLTMSIEPFLRCLKGAYARAREAFLTMLNGCIVVCVPALKLFHLLFPKQEWLSNALGFLSMILTYFVYVLAYNYYLKKQDDDS